MLISVAMVVATKPKHHHVTDVLKSLHWPKITKQIQFKVHLLTILTTQISSRPLRHPINPLCQILLLSQSFSTPVTTRVKFSNPSHTQHVILPRLLYDLLPELRTFSVHPPPLSISLLHPSPSSRSFEIKVYEVTTAPSTVQE